MRSSVFVFLLLAMFLPSGFLLAQAGSKPVTPAAGASQPAAKITSKLPHQFIYPGDGFYPEELAKKGVQGEVTLEIQLSKDGKTSVTRLIGSSKSAELDKNALNLVNTGFYKLPENGLKYFEGIYTLNIIFLRDSVLTINKKTCADLNTDLAYFRSVAPNESIRNLPAFELMANIFTVQLMKDRGANGALAFVKSVNAIDNDVAQTCARKPAALLVKTYVQASGRQGVKL